jgi:hypothetical protein
MLGRLGRVTIAIVTALPGYPAEPLPLDAGQASIIQAGTLRAITKSSQG